VGEAIVKAETRQIEKGEIPSESQPSKVLISADGAYIALTGGEWREVKTVSIGEFETVVEADGTEKVETGSLSYFSRSYRAREFEYYALPEVHRRGVVNAPLVVTVNDGAEWIQNFADYHCEDAVRVLDFSHAQNYLADAGKVVYGEETDCFQSWFRTNSHLLKHEGPQPVLTTLTQLSRQVNQPQDRQIIDGSLTYLGKRGAMLNYPHFQQQGYPIGSGCVESAHKVVVQSRMKQAGMRWAEANVDPMLALRNLICNDRWSQGWQQIVTYRRQQQLEKQRRKCRLALQPSVPNEPDKPIKSISTTSIPTKTKPDPTRPKQPRRPAADHPWRHSPVGRARFTKP
jgi:DNA repair exonuclease SbcCD nuclease subunit